MAAKKSMPSFLKKKIAKTSTGAGRKTSHLKQFQFKKGGGKKKGK